MDENNDLIKLDGIEDESIAKVIANPAVQVALAKTIEAAKQPLVAKRDELLTQISKSKETLSQVEQLGGLDRISALAGEAARAEKEAKAAEMKALEESGNVKKISEHYATQLKASQDELNALKTSLVERDISNRLLKEISKAGGVSELLEPVVKGRVRGKFDDAGATKIEVLTAEGAPMLLDDGTPASIKDLIATLKDNPVYGRAFDGSGKGGTGSKPSSAGNDENPFDSKSPAFNMTKAMAMYKQDPSKARQLAAKAGVDVSKWNG